MFGKLHIARDGVSLCHSREGILISFTEAQGMNPTNCCEDCRRRYKNITGTNLLKPEINKALLRAKTNTLNTEYNEKINMD